MNEDRISKNILNLEHKGKCQGIRLSLRMEQELWNEREVEERLGWQNKH
jgi:hypothetical protein